MENGEWIYLTTQGYDKYINKVSMLDLNISYDPLYSKSGGYYLFDDATIPAKVVTLFKDGEFTGNLIGGTWGSKIVDSSLRRERYSDKLLPRMSNLIVTSSSTCNYPNEYIRIDKLSKCFADHKEKRVIFHVESAFLIKNQICIARIKPFSISMTLDQVFKNVEPMQTDDFIMRSIQCQKQNQIVNCGSMSINWVYNN